jgi:hypothetical protein
VKEREVKRKEKRGRGGVPQRCYAVGRAAPRSSENSKMKKKRRKKKSTATTKRIQNVVENKNVESTQKGEQEKTR